MADTPATEHVDYPHYPGELYDCPGCAAQCHCDNQGDCVYCAIRQEEMGHT